MLSQRLGTPGDWRATLAKLLGIHVTALAELIGMLKRSSADVARVLEAVPAREIFEAAIGHRFAKDNMTNVAKLFTWL
ncbi:hypothetical protein [Paraburkholderia sp. C35]|uniref:hypothetical protein n=1 Tax=Paraburkholderia sp. C35 TaxID=2126993 RepID=UPI000D699357|nr:hypothetical protein [Paraburkholderia sp. C35]